MSEALGARAAIIEKASRRLPQDNRPEGRDRATVCVERRLPGGTIGHRHPHPTIPKIVRAAAKILVEEPGAPLLLLEWIKNLNPDTGGSRCDLT